jgi:hypothetical protein
MVKNRLAVSFRTKLHIYWIVSFRNRLSNDNVAEQEQLARFIFYTKEFDSGTNSVKPAAFLVKEASTAHSVYRTANLEHSLICAAGDWLVAPPRKKPIYGYAHVVVTDVTERGCTVQASEPPTRHAHITNWPGTKAERLSAAQQLAGAADLCLV